MNLNVAPARHLVGWAAVFSAAAFSLWYNAVAMNPAVGFKRKNIRLPAERYRGQGLFFVTLCFAGRRRFGTNARLASWIVSRLRKHADACDFSAHAYCIMPDHIHALLAGKTEQSDLIKFVESFKQDTAIAFSQRAHRPLWQFKYYDHVLRASDRADGVAWYIWMNPVRQGICATPLEYSFLGSFTELGKKLLKGSAAPEWKPPWKKNTNQRLPG